MELAAEVNRFLGQGWDGHGMRMGKFRATDSGRVYLDRRLWEGWASLRYLIPATDRFSVFATEGLPARDSNAGEVMIVCWPYADYHPARSLLPEYSLISVVEGSKERGDLEPEARLLYIAFTSRRGQEVPHNIEQRFEQGITLLGYSPQPLSATKLAVRLYWQAEVLLKESYTVFVHVRRGEQLIGQDDAPPARGRYPTSYWRVGDTVIDEHVVTLSAPAIPQQDEMWVGLYRLETQQRLQLVNDANQFVGDHIVLRLSDNR